MPQALMPPLGLNRIAVAVLGLCAGAALAQADAPGGAGQRDWLIEPSITLRQTFTDNARHTVAKNSDSVTDLIAGLRVGRDRGWLRGALGYSLTGSLSSRDSDRNEARHALSLSALAELVPSTVFVDTGAELSQQAISAFGAPAPSSGARDTNEARTGSVRLSPYLRGGAPSLRYEARLSHTVTRSEAANNVGDATFSAAALRLGNTGERALLGWTADLTHDRSEYRTGRETESTRGRLGANYLVSGDLRLGATVGSERSDVFTLGGETVTTYGVTAQWNPSPRTVLDASVERRVFGTGHSLRFTHRMPNTSWTLSSSRDVNTPTVSGTAEFGSVYDLLSRQFEATEPDAAKRDRMVRDLLAANGLQPDAVVVGGFLASSAVLQRAHSASVSLLGARNTVTLQLQATHSRRADNVSPGLDDLSSVDEVEQRGVLIDWVFRLSPSQSIRLGAGYQRSEGQGGPAVSRLSTTKSFDAAWSYVLAGGRSSVAAGLRHANFSSAANPYEENTVFASFSMRF
jgi:uncharacterized protein (PEP-CTERM system associated)